MARARTEVTEEEFNALAAEAEASRRESARAHGAGGAVFLLGVLLGLIWIASVGVGAYAFFGLPRLMAMTPLEAAELGAAALLPAAMVWIAAATAREGARARAEARRLADAANQLLAPAPGAEAATRRVALAVRSEIAALDRALEQTLNRLKDVEAQVARQSEAVDQMAGQARAGAGQMITGMEQERADLLRISQDLTAQAQMIGQSIGRHTKAIAEAARLAETEVRAADEALEARLSSFGAAAALVTDRTHAINGAAQASADSALRLETALATALDVLAKATHLTDAARDSAQAATLAANSTAHSVRETTTRAVADAKRAADMIRGEASAVEKEASSALERLRDAANHARSTAHDVRDAVEQPREQPRAPSNFMRNPAQPPSPFGEPPARPMDRAPPQSAPRPARTDAPGEGGAWTWRDLLSNMEPEEAPAPPREARTQAPREARTQARRETREEPRREAPAEEPREARRQEEPRPRTRDAEPSFEPNDAVTRLHRVAVEPRPPGPHPIPAAAAIERAGVRLNETFSRGALDRIAQRARTGTQARRRAVRDAAPDAVNAVADFIDRDATARQDAAHFLKNDGARIAELLGRGRASMSADATRIFLLIDAAAG
ncbi:MAG: hypothetical protein AB7L65_02545 [Hyphomonadaceae bacterium]